MAALTLLSSSKCHEGYQRVYGHKSDVLRCEMKFSLFLPHQEKDEKFPVLFWLSGLECTERNFIDKSGFQAYAAKHKLMVVCPDTSPRGCNIEGEDDSWDFGTGAGFYIDATEQKWKDHYRMFSYVTDELPSLINKEFPTNGLMSISGHSMGGHGALICGLKNPGKYASISAFAPICNPMNCPWGKKVFSGYLGNDKETWKAFDGTCIIKTYSGPTVEIMIDQGTEDKFLHDGQLLPDNLMDACKDNKNVKVDLKKREGYDHGYFFINTFIGNHIAFHAQHLRKQ